MGLLLSILVVCVGVLEAVSCFRHIQDGYLPFWMPRRCVPTIAERRRRAPSDDSSSSSEEISRIFLNDASAHPNASRLEPNYGLTPILSEHRRNTPILRDEEAEEEEGVGEAKYVENNIDACCSSETRNAGNQSPPIIERFRPISPPELPEQQDGAGDAVGSASAPFGLRDPETAERSVSEETLCDLESDVTDDVEPLVDALTGSTGGASSALESLESVLVALVAETKSVTKYEEPADVEEPRAEISSDKNQELIPTTDSPQNHVETPVETLEDNLQSPSETLPDDPDDLELQALVDTLHSNTKTLPTKTLVDAHPEIPPPLAFSDAPLSRPGTPSTPRKVKADISWPVFHPDEPVIKRPPSEFGKPLRLSLSRDDSIDEDLMDAEDNVERVPGGASPSDFQPRPDLDMFLDGLEGSFEAGNVGDNVERVPDESRPDLDMFLDGLEGSFEAGNVGENVERVNVQERQVHDLAGANLLTDSQAKIDADAFLKCLEAEEAEFGEGRDSQGDSEQIGTPSRFDATSSQDMDTFLAGLETSFSPVIPQDTSLPLSANNTPTPQEPFQLDSNTESTLTAQDISTHLPTIPSELFRPSVRATSPTIKAMEDDVQVVDDHFSKTVISEPVEISTPCVDLEAIPPARSTAIAGKLDEDPRACKSAVVDQYGRILGVESEAEMLKRLEAMIEKVEVKEEAAERQVAKGVENGTPVAVERQFDKSVASDTERLVSLSDIIEPPCQKVTTYSVAEVKPVSDVDSEVKDTELESAKDETDVNLCAVGTEVDSAELEKEVETTDSTQVVDEVKLEGIRTDIEPILEAKSAPDKQTNENASEFEATKEAASLAVAKHPSSVSIEIDRAPDDEEDRDVDSSESLSLCKDITSKESSIKRRKSYKDKKRNSTSPRSSTETIPEDVRKKDAVVEQRKAFGRKDTAKQEEQTVKDEVAKPRGETETVGAQNDIADIHPDKQEGQKVSEDLTQSVQKEDDDEPTPPEVVRRRESATEAILNKELLPVEVLHSGETSKESAVFATASHEQRRRLKKPARAESFEEAPIEVKLQGKLTTSVGDGDSKVGGVEVEKSLPIPLERGGDGESKNMGEVSDAVKISDVAGGVEVGKSSPIPLERGGDGESKNMGEVSDAGKMSDEKCTDPGATVAARGGNETNPSVDESLTSSTSDVKRPTQGSNPAFWVRGV